MNMRTAFPRAVASVDGKAVVTCRREQGRILLNATMPKQFFEPTDSEETFLGGLLGQKREAVTVIDPVTGLGMTAYRAVDPVNDDSRIWIDRENPSEVFRTNSHLLYKKWHAHFESSIESAGFVRRALFTGYCLATAMQYGGELVISDTLRDILGQDCTAVIKSELTRAYADPATTRPVLPKDVTSSIAAIITNPDQFPPR